MSLTTTESFHMQIILALNLKLKNYVEIATVKKQPSLSLRAEQKSSLEYLLAVFRFWPNRRRRIVELDENREE